MVKLVGKGFTSCVIDSSLRVTPACILHFLKLILLLWIKISGTGRGQSKLRQPLFGEYTKIFLFEVGDKFW